MRSRKLIFFAAVAAVLAMAVLGRTLLLDRAEQNLSQQRYEEAFDQFKWPAVLGDSHAQYMMGNAFAFGRGVEKNHDAALRWFERACLFDVREHCEKSAVHDVAQRYLSGAEIGYDLAEAMWWMERSADLGVAGAAETLEDLRETVVAVEK